MKESRIGYMCLVDFLYHLEHDMNPTKVFTSLERLRVERSCVKECGIAKVKISLLKELK